MRVIAFRRVKDPYGWLGNMSPHPVTYAGQEWRTTEALFQALRFTFQSPVRELIREQRSPMAAKMLSKKHADERQIVPLSEDDLDAMRLCLHLKVEQHPRLKAELLETGDALLVEDCTARPQGTGLFWGAELKPDGTWNGVNTLGLLWMELREDLRRNDGEQKEGCGEEDA